MKTDAPMDSYASRLASFNATVTTQKKRASDTKGTKVLKWPHTEPSTTQLARAGFFYKPTTSNPDNATCYLCHCNLDGWEEDDDPVEEHLKHSPSCGWAIIASVEHAVENGERDLEDPASEKSENARSMTFGSSWPHESKRGWVCKIPKMVEAGWYYCPTLESDDFVKCAYCNLSLDGWEPKDNPYDEHQRRSPTCLFFSLSATLSNTHGYKSKKSRNSKASRASTQSTLSAASEISSLLESDLHDERVAPERDIVKPAKGGKKGPKSKKAKSQMLTPNIEESQIGSSFVEPEDDDFEVKVMQPIVSAAKGKKRKSEETIQPGEVAGRSGPKRRRTVVRDSVASDSGAIQKFDESGQIVADVDAKMTDLESKPCSSKSKPKKPKKSGKKRGSSAVRKASSKSTASEASLRAGLPNDEEIDAALTEDLDRPLTDNGEDEELEVLEPPKGRRLTRNKAGTGNTNASTAPARRNTRSSTIVENNLPEIYPDSLTSHPDGAQLPESVQEPSLQLSPDTKTKKKKGTRKGIAKERSKANDARNEEEVLAPATDKAELAKPRQMRAGKPQEQPLGESHHASPDAKLEVEMNFESKIDESILDVQALEGDSERETDTNPKGRPKRGKKASTAKNVGGGKRKNPKNSDTEHLATTTAFDHSKSELNEVIAPALANDASKLDLDTAELKKPTKKQGKAAKSGAKTKGRKKAPKNVEVEAVQIVETAGAERLMNAPLSPVAPSMHSTPNLAPSPQSSDAENQPPSSRPSQSRPPLAFESPLRSQETRVPLAVIATPSASPSKGGLSKLRSTFPWTAIDIEKVLHSTPDTAKENGHFEIEAKKLSSPEKNLTVEEWIKQNAEKGEARLRNDCERLVGSFEDQGVRALKTLEGISCVD